MRVFLMVRFLIKGNINQKNNNRQKRIHQSYIITYISKINHLLDSSLNFLAKSKNRIPSISLYVNTIKSSKVVMGVITGSINNIINNPAAKFTSRSDNISNHTIEILNI